MTARPSRPGGLSSAGPALPPALPRPGRLGPGSCGRAGGSGVSGVSWVGVPSRSRARPALTIAPAPLRPSRNPPGAGTAPATAPAKGQESPERGRAALLGLGFNPRATRAGSKRSDNNQTDRHLFTYFRAAQAWVLRGLPQTKHPNYQFILLFMPLRNKGIGAHWLQVHSSLIN